MMYAKEQIQADQKHPSEKTTYRELWEREIITHILRFGIKPAAALDRIGKKKLRSTDAVPRGYVEGCRIIRPSGILPFGHSWDLRRELYGHTRSLFPVVVERPDIKAELLYGNEDTTPSFLSQEQLHLFSRRTQTSFAVVCLYEQIRPYIAMPQYGEIGKTVPPQMFVRLLFPQPVWMRQKQALSARSQSMSIPVRATRSEVIGRGMTQPLIVPDYESVISHLSYTYDQDLWVHGVRLPTEEDIA